MEIGRHEEEQIYFFTLFLVSNAFLKYRMNKKNLHTI